MPAWNDKELVGMGRALGDGDDCIIFGLAVLPKYQRQGIGTELLLRLCAKEKKQGYYGINLYASFDNKNAKKFYESFGFESVHNAMWKKL